MIPNDKTLMTIGAFAQRSGLTASALRFYADSGLLAPAEVDAASGYRFYDEAQLEPATLLRRLRGPELPATIRSADNGDLTTLAMPTARV